MPAPDPEVLAARIKAERLRLSLTPTQIAAALGVKRESYLQLERHANPRFSTVGALVGVGMRIASLAPEWVPGRRPAG